MSEEKGKKRIDVNALIVALVQNDNAIWDIMNDFDTMDIKKLRKDFSREKYLNDEFKVNKPLIIRISINNGDSFMEEESDKQDLTCNMFELLNTKFKPDKHKVILGRDREIEKVFTTFQKMTTRNVILVGEPGVGKTAIVEGIAERIVKKLCPKEFEGKRVLCLDMNGLLENTKYIGQREEKFKPLNKYLEEHDDVILFIDEIHNIIGAGRTANSSNDLANALKPILTNGKVRVIGATTREEYYQYFSMDSVLKRRFDLIEIGEPSNNDELFKMLQGRIKQLEKHHGVKVNEEAFKSVVTQASVYHWEVANPARTVAVLDTAMVIAKNLGKESLDKEAILKVHEENMANFKKMSLKQKNAVASHEVGHYILNQEVNSENTEVVAISIIPAEDYLGVNVLEFKDKFITKSRECYINEIATLLAGDIACHLMGYEKNSGKSSDLERATNIARNMVLRYGMAKNSILLGKCVSYSQGSEIVMEYLSDKQKEELSVQIDNILNEAYELAERILKEKKDLLVKIVDILVKNGILYQNELTSLNKL